MTLPLRWEWPTSSTPHTNPPYSPPQQTLIYPRHLIINLYLNSRCHSYPTFLRAVGHGDPYGIPLRFEITIKQDILTIQYFLATPLNSHDYYPYSNYPAAALYDDVLNDHNAPKTLNIFASPHNEYPENSRPTSPTDNDAPNTRATADDSNTSTPMTASNSYNISPHITTILTNEDVPYACTTSPINSDTQNLPKYSNNPDVSSADDVSYSHKILMPPTDIDTQNLSTYPDNPAPPQT
mmetsp:Transcript_59287/g.70742  ORF Transcript_59287/g.70742 Transcript_59287/m.70742 type:complete len:238 (-) Transcript_59287:800-1513(-)